MKQFNLRESKQLRLTLAPLSNASQQLIGYVSIFEDITKQKEFEEKLRLEESFEKHGRSSCKPDQRAAKIQVSF
jgi:hypothetical protein